MSNKSLIICSVLIILIIFVAYYIFIDSKHNTTNIPNKRRHVRFDENVDYKFFNKNNNPPIDVDDIMEKIYNSPDNQSDTESSSNIFAFNDIATSENDSYNTFDKIVPDTDKQKYNNKLLKEHNDYCNSYSKYNQYQLDNETIIKNDTTIDFSGKSNQGRKIKDIYDSATTTKYVKKKSELYNPDDHFDKNDQSEIGTYSGIDNIYSTAYFADGFVQKN